MISPEPISILLVGDPGTGKTSILKSIQKVIRNSAYMSGNIYGRLTSTKEIAISEISRKSDVLLIDNITNIPEKEKPIINELMDLGSPIIAAGNPKFGRFDPYEIISNQIYLSPTIINKFDLIFPIKDLPDETRDGKVIDFLFENKQKEVKLDDFTKFREECLKNKVELSKEAKKLIKDYYIKIRQATWNDEGDTIIKSVALSLKQAKTIAKLTKVYASINKKPIASEKDALRAIRILEYCLAQVGFDKTTGKIDIDRVGTGISASFRGDIKKVYNAILDLEQNIGKTIPVEDIFEHKNVKGIDEVEIDETIEMLKRKGTIFEPRVGFISRI
jgi:replicative DNA helicase Mcm